MKKSIFSALCLVLLATTTQSAWGAEELASWTFSSGNYPSNKTDFTATSGSCSNSTFYLNGTGSTWNDTKGWAFTAVTDIQITIKAASNITQGSVLTFKVTTFYNKASNAPMKGFSLTCKESTGNFGTTGLSPTSWSLSNSSAEYSVTYTTQNNIVKDNTIVLKLTQTGKAGSGQGFMGPIVVTMESGTSSTTLYLGLFLAAFVAVRACVRRVECLYATFHHIIMSKIDFRSVHFAKALFVLFSVHFFCLTKRNERKKSQDCGGCVAKNLSFRCRLNRTRCARTAI